MLDKNGRGSAGLSHRAAKVYRKMFSHNKENLYFQNNGREKIPKWLGGRSFRDVTDQYMKTSDVSVQLATPPPQESRFAYICVFNGGKWRAIHWANIKEKQATFSKMGRNIAYLVAYFVDDDFVAAAPPIIVDADGKTTQLVADDEQLKKRGMSQTTSPKPKKPGKSDPSIQPAKTQPKYQLYVWITNWEPLGEPIVDPKNPAIISKLPNGGLYWLAKSANRETARIFTVENGKPRFW
jgi:hypothetical protein